MIMNYIALLSLMMPLMGSVIVGLNSSRICYSLANIITSVCVFLSAFFSYILFYNAVFTEQSVHIKLFEWLNVYGLKSDWSIYIDQLTACMLIVVNTVSFLVHVYSIGYMSHDDHKQRFMSYLSLFTFFMLLLVMSDNFLQLFVGWEGVGLSSYLLIGFWFKKTAARDAAIKAFLVNRVGDVGLILGIILIYITFGSLEFQTVFPLVKEAALNNYIFFGIDVNVITLICVLLFIGCAGKSAQLGLHVWLPDAMEGPTPVSALIHAATMVTAGIFLAVRCSYLFEYSVCALNLMACVGAATALFAAFVALTQKDIKRIIAYSTCSQLGYMFFACGVSAYHAAMFHLITHAFFKALLFLCAGSVIHALDGEQDIFKMGGIAKKIKATCTLMWIGSFAIAGIFPFAGFYSKDLILELAYSSNSGFAFPVYWIGILVACLTAFYSWRLLIVVFHGQTTLDSNKIAKVHESPLTMILPLIILSIFSILSGIVGMKYFGIDDIKFWGQSIFILRSYTVIHFGEFIPLIASLSGITVACLLYLFRRNLADALSKKLSFFYLLSINKFFFDELYSLIIVRPFREVGKVLWKFVDNKLVDGMPNGSSVLVYRCSRMFSVLQSGYIYHYAMFIALSAVLIIYFMLFH